MADSWDCAGELGGGWNSRFLRFFNDWELEHVYNFFASTPKKRLYLERRNSLVCKFSKKGIFTVKSLYDSLMGVRVG